MHGILRASAPTRTALRFIGLPFVLLVYSGLFALYFLALHPLIMSWGATPAEQAIALPGDEVGTSPAAYFTRAITIDAPADRVWPWLVQIGQDRAGFYSNDWLENLFGGDIHNASVIRAEWQSRQVGDKVPMAPRGYLGGAMDDATVTVIRVLEPNQLIADTPGRFVLLPIDDHTTRLLVREAYAANTPGGGGAGVVVRSLVWDPLHFVMVQRMMRGIKERAEGQPLVVPVVLVVARIGWALAGLGLVAVFLSRRHGYLWLLVPIAAVTPQLISTRDPSAVLAGFLAVGITVAGALVFGRRWWPAYALIAAGVALVLLLAPDAYVAFGLLFDLILAVAVVAIIRRRDAAAPITPIRARLAA
jgi:hypothetical protein